MPLRISAIFLVLILLLSLAAPAFATVEDNGDLIVYRTDTGKYYHRGSCGYLRSKHEITLREAVERGLSPCSRCHPPIFNGERADDHAKTPKLKAQDVSRSSGSSTEKDTPWYVFVLAALVVPFVPLIIIFIGGLFFDFLSLPAVLADFIKRKRK